VYNIGLTMAVLAEISSQ